MLTWVTAVQCVTSVCVNLGYYSVACNICVCQWKVCRLSDGQIFEYKNSQFTCEFLWIKKSSVAIFITFIFLRIRMHSGYLQVHFIDRMVTVINKQKFENSSRKNKKEKKDYCSPSCAFRQWPRVPFPMASSSRHCLQKAQKMVVCMNNLRTRRKMEKRAN